MDELGERFIYNGHRMTLRTLLRMVIDLYNQHGKVVVTVAPAAGEQERRTNAQNRFMWQMITQIARHEGATKEDTKDFLLDTIYGDKFAVVHGKPVQHRPKTSKFTKKQMVKFIDACLHWADTECSGPVMMPPEYEEWRSR